MKCQYPQKSEIKIIIMPNISIETDRLLLREMSLSDMEALSSILQDENVMYAYNGAFSDEETLAWMQSSCDGTESMVSACGAYS